MTASAKGDAVAPGTNVRQKAGLNREILDTSPGMLIATLLGIRHTSSGLNMKMNSTLAGVTGCVEI